MADLSVEDIVVWIQITDCWVDGLEIVFGFHGPSGGISLCLTFTFVPTTVRYLKKSQQLNNEVCSAQL